MDSQVADRHDNGEHQHIPSDTTADFLEPRSLNLSDPAPTNSFNGDHLPLPDPKHAAEIERSVADNRVLVDEIASLRDAHAARQHTRELLQRELIASSERVEALNAEIASLQMEKRKNEDLAASMAQEVLVLHAENMDLQAQNANTASETRSLDAMLAETKEKSSLLARDVEEKQAAMAAAQTHIHMICFEVEKLQLEKAEYSKELSLLDASNSTMNTKISQLREEEKALTSEVDQVVAANALAEQKVSNAHASIAALKEQVSALAQTDDDMQTKFCEAKEKVRQLEEQDKSMVEREREMETCILDLESRVHTLKANFDTTQEALEQEKEAKWRPPEVMHMKVAASERDLHVLESLSDVKQQQAQDLKCHISDLREEKEGLAHSNKELQAELRKTQEEPETEELNQLKEDIERLESALKEAKGRVHLSESKETKLRCKLQELFILAEQKPKFSGFATPLVISGGTIVALGLLVYLLRSNSRSK